MPDDGPTTLCIDNQLAITIAKNPQFHNQTKHIKVQYYYLCDKVEEEELKLEYVLTGKQIADALTKVLNKDKHTTFVKEIGVLCPVRGGMLEIQTACR